MFVIGQLCRNSFHRHLHSLLHEDATSELANAAAFLLRARNDIGSYTETPQDVREDVGIEDNVDAASRTSVEKPPKHQVEDSLTATPSV